MSLELNSTTVFVDMRLTSLGRQLASLGRLRYAKAVIRDNEMDYRYESPYYDLSGNFVISPFDTAQTIPAVNFDGTPAIPLGPRNLIRGRENEEVEILDSPLFYSGGTGWRLDESKCIAKGTTLVSSMAGGSNLEIDSITAINQAYAGAIEEACVGRLVMIRHHASYSATLDPLADIPFVSLWYRINAWDSGTSFELDRALPNFATGTDSISWYVYPWSGVSPYYASASTTADTTYYHATFQWSDGFNLLDYAGPFRWTGQINEGRKVYTPTGVPDFSLVGATDLILLVDVDRWIIYYNSQIVFETVAPSEPTPDLATGWTAGFYGGDPTPTFELRSESTGARIWDMHIVRTINEIGSTGATTGYTTYGSIAYNGTKHVLGFDADQRAVGFIFRDDPTLDIDEAERLQLSSTTLYAPTLLWHRKPEYQPGQGTRGGHTFTDRKSLLYYDSVAQLPYSRLMDGTDGGAIEVGRVYHDLRMVAITDPELLNAMSYKSNRNWTMPPLKLSLEEVYEAGDTGLCKSNKTYLATYVMQADAAYSFSASFSYRKFIHCGHITRIDGIDGGPYALVARLANSHFPYMRTADRLDVFSGTGWNANDFYILIKEMDKTEFSGMSKVSHSGWKRLTTGGEYSNQHSEVTISPSGLTSYQFTITQGDYNSAAAYTLDSINGDGFDRTFSGLSYGDESFFFGNVEYDLNKDPEKVSIKFALMPNDFNSTQNTSFGEDNEDTYVTGIYILDDLDRVVATAKPSSPVKKNYGRYVEFKLDLIY